MKTALKQESELDKIADEFAELMLNSERLEDILKRGEENKIIQKRVSKDIDVIKNRIAILENRLNKLVNNFRIDIVEAERMITQKAEELNNENDQRITNLVSQVENLRGAMIRLSNDVKEIKNFVGYYKK